MDLVVLLLLEKAYIIQTVPTLSSVKYILYIRYMIEKKTRMLPKIKIINLWSGGHV